MPGTATAELVIDASGLTKRFGDRTVVDGLDLQVFAGQVHALLGPNGSGKTTTVRMLTSLIPADAGRARVCGHDLRTGGAEVRGSIGLVGQFTALDRRLSGLENLTMFGRLHGLSKRAARARSLELLERFGLVDAADRTVGAYSGGMSRRLDLLAAFVVRPLVLFLDEPTTGLDPISRNLIYGQVREFVAEGSSVVLTTQYLDEADRLADHLTILDRGATVASGTPSQIKHRVGGGIDVVLADGGRTADAVSLLEANGLQLTADSATGAGDSRRLSFAADTDDIDLFNTFGRLHDAGIDVEDIGRRVVRLDEAFLMLVNAGRKPVHEGKAP
jgi:ABC-2 type transport system ATP-binding protein